MNSLVLFPITGTCWRLPHVKQGDLQYNRRGRHVSLDIRPPSTVNTQRIMHESRCWSQQQHLQIQPGNEATAGHTSRTADSLSHSSDVSTCLSLPTYSSAQHEDSKGCCRCCHATACKAHTKPFTCKHDGSDGPAQVNAWQPTSEQGRLVVTHLCFGHWHP